jgi:hypothetical protein
MSYNESSDDEIMDDEIIDDEIIDDEIMDEPEDILIDEDDDEYRGRLKPVKQIKFDPKNMFRKDESITNKKKRGIEDISTQSFKKSKIEVKSHFFTNAIVKSYLSNITDQLTNKTIINLDQLEDYFGNEIRNSYYSIAVRLRQELPKQQICANISKSYLSENLERAVEQPGAYINYDTAFLIDTSIPKDVNNIESAIIGFIIVQRNECNQFSNAYALKLICSRKCQNCGFYLLGLYLYSILSHPKKNDTKLLLEPIIQPSVENEAYFGPPILHMGILELGGSYITTSALCLYTKFGFAINENLTGTNAAGMSVNCFTNADNIGMIKRFKTDESISNPDTLINVIGDTFDIDNEKAKIIRIVRKEDPGYKKHIICEFTNKNTQRKLAELYIDLQINQKKYAVLIHQSKFILNREGDEIKPEFKNKMNVVEDQIRTIQNLINKIESSPRDMDVEELGIIGGVKRLRNSVKRLRNHKMVNTYKKRNTYKKGNTNKRSKKLRKTVKK